MYNFIFYYFYRYFESKKDFSPRFSALCAVAGAQYIHAFFLVTAIKHTFKINILPTAFSHSYIINKLYWMPILAIWLLFTYFYYRKDRVVHILEERDKLGEKVFTFKNIAIIILVIGVPLILGIMFIKKSETI